MDKIFHTMITMSLTSSIVIIAVLFARLLLKRAPKVFSYVLWSVVLFRLICPFTLESAIGFISSSQQTQISSFILEETVSAENSSDMQSGDSILIQENASQTQLSRLKESRRSQSTATVKQTVFMIAEYIWLCGIAVFVFYSMYSFWRLKRKLVGAVEVETHIYEQEELRTPFVLGIVRPKIYLPKGLTGEERSYILAHEKMHVRRLDYLVKLAGYLVLMVHWMNPFVWVAFVCMTRDMEMSCDEAVLRRLGSGIKKEYSTTLLNMAVGRKRMTGPLLAFGEGDVEGRIKNVLRYRRTGMGLIAASVLLVAGATLFLATNRSEPDNRFRIAMSGEESGTVGLVQQYDYNSDVKSYMVYAVILENGTETQRNIVFSGTISEENPNGEMEILVNYNSEESSPVVTVSCVSGAKSQFVSYRLSDYRMRAGSVLWSDERYHDIVLGQPYILAAEYIGGSETERIEAYTCENILSDESIGDAVLEQSRESDITSIMICYVASEKTEKELIGDLNRMQTISTGSKTETGNTESSDTESSNAEEQLRVWAQAFCERNGEQILAMTSEHARDQLEEQGLLERAGGTVSFGISSPWPMSPDNNFTIGSITENTAEILYYAVVSDPHVTVWHESVSFTIDDGSFVVTAEELTYGDHIVTMEEFETVYPDGKIAGTPMDYTQNGLGQALNQNALLSSSMAYTDLFSPDTAAVYLLNLLKNENKVETAQGYINEGTWEAAVEINFVESNRKIIVKMVQPFGTDGIWIPQDIMEKV